MSIAVTTKRLPGTEHHGPNISARMSDGVYLLVPWDYERNPIEQHAEVARALLRKRRHECAEDQVASAPWRRGFFHVFGN
jgi:hypothetical protein